MKDYDYESAREEAKLGTFMTCCMIFKATIGVGIFTFQYAYGKCGILLGTLVGGLVFYMVTYGIDLLLGLCDIIERNENGLLRQGQEAREGEPAGETSRENTQNIAVRLRPSEEVVREKLSDNIFTVVYQLLPGKRYEIITYHQIPNRVQGRSREAIALISIVASIGMCLGFGVGNYVYLIKAAAELFSISENLTSLIIYGVMLVLLVLIIEPEKIKFVAFVVVAFILCSSFVLLGKNSWDMVEGRFADDYNVAEPKQIGIVVGVALFSFESISFIINVRRMTKHKNKMRQYTRWTFFFASVFFLFFAFSFHIVHGRREMHDIAFDFFKETDKWIFYLKYLVAFNPLFAVPFSTITIIEIFEKVRPLSSFLRIGGSQSAALSPWRIFFTRLALLTLMFACTLIDAPIEIIFNIVGSAFGPFLGMIIPVLCWHAITPCGWLRKTHDFFYLILSVVFGALGLIYVFQSDK